MKSGKKNSPEKGQNMRKGRKNGQGPQQRPSAKQSLGHSGEPNIQASYETRRHEVPKVNDGAEQTTTVSLPTPVLQALLDGNAVIEVETKLHELRVKNIEDESKMRTRCTLYHFAIHATGILLLGIIAYLVYRVTGH